MLYTLDSEGTTRSVRLVRAGDALRLWWCVLVGLLMTACAERKAVSQEARPVSEAPEVAVDLGFDQDYLAAIAKWHAPSDEHPRFSECSPAIGVVPEPEAVYPRAIKFRPFLYGVVSHKQSGKLWVVEYSRLDGSALEWYGPMRKTGDYLLFL